MINKNLLFKQFNQNTPGCAVSIVRNEKVEFEQYIGLADLQNQTPITETTAFRLASLTKPFTAMAIMILKEKGLLSFDDTLGSFFPDFPRYGKDITLRQLLSHTSGIPDHEKPLYKRIKKGYEPTIYDALDVLKKEKTLLFPSGTKYEYSDAGFVVLALVIEKVSREKYGTFLEENIFKPLKMKNTLVVDETKPEIKNRAFGYTKRNNKWELYDYDPLNYVVGDEGIYSTGKDLPLWQKAWTEELLVSRKTLNEALENKTLKNGGKSRCGFSWFIEELRGKRIVFHDGFWVGFNNIMLTDCNKDATIIMLSNTTEFEGEKKKIDTALKIVESVS